MSFGVIRLIMPGRSCAGIFRYSERMNEVTTNVRPFAPLFRLMNLPSTPMRTSPRNPSARCWPNSPAPTARTTQPVAFSGRRCPRGGPCTAVRVPHIRAGARYDTDAPRVANNQQPSGALSQNLSSAGPVVVNQDHRRVPVSACPPLLGQGKASCPWHPGKIGKLFFDQACYFSFRNHGLIPAMCVPGDPA